MKLLILVPMIHRSSKSNGIRTLLDIALELQALNHEVFIYPTLMSRFISLSDLDPKYQPLNISPIIPDGCIALIPDSADPDDVDRVRSRVTNIFWYSLAVPGLFRSISIPFIPRLPGEHEIVYSPQISSIFPSFYYQPFFQKLKPYISARLKVSKTPKHLSRFSKPRIALYQGKGRLSTPYPNSLLKLLKRSKILYITREYPPNKNALYNLLSTCDALISLDPLSSLNYEAILLGIPVYVHNRWDEDFASTFPVNLDGISYGDIDKFMYDFNNGFNHISVHESYLDAIDRNQSVVKALAEYISTTSMQTYSPIQNKLNAELLNTYWLTRNPTDLELSICYSKAYLRSGGTINGDVLRYCFAKSFRFGLRLLKLPLSIPKALFRSARRLLLTLAKQ